MRIALTLFGVISYAAFSSGQFNTWMDPVGLLRITPAGMDIPTGRRVVFQFNRPVVAMGCMERNAEEIPIDFQPELSCEWHWLKIVVTQPKAPKDHGFVNHGNHLSKIEGL